MEIVCPYCGYRGKPEDFTYMYEAVVYVADSTAVPEERERPVLVVCPRCRGGFFLEPPYKRLVSRMSELREAGEEQGLRTT